jgi:hypothetical protein
MNDSFGQRHENLPPELQAALREFDAWSQERLLVEQILVGPLAPTDAEAMVLALVKGLGYSENIPIQRSTANP